MMFTNRAKNGVLCNCLLNGGFSGVECWELVDASYVADKGGAMAGSAGIDAGGMVSQPFTISSMQAWDVSFSLYGYAGDGVTICILDSENNAVYQESVVIAAPNEWQVHTVQIGLPMGEYTYQLKANDTNDNRVCVDDASVNFEPITLVELVAMAGAKLGSFLPPNCPMPTSDDELGDWEQAVLACMRQFGAIDPMTGKPSTRCIDPYAIDEMCDCIENKIACTLLFSYWSRQVSEFTLGELTEKKNQAVLDSLCKKFGIGNDVPRATRTGRTFGCIPLTYPDRCGCHRSPCICGSSTMPSLSHGKGGW